MSNEIETRRIRMKVAAKVLQAISTGIYRTPANAIKELVSNAFDADCTRVHIDVTTDDNGRAVALKVRDNGSGINDKDFGFSMEHIGYSLKRLEGNKTPGGRPIIGRIGIGLLSVGQASHKFVLRSATGKGKQIMKADIDLTSYYDARLNAQSLDELDIGNVLISSEAELASESFTEIILPSIQEPFSSDISSHGQSFNFNNSSYAEFVKWIDQAEVRRDEEMSGFDRFIFELGLLCPVRYLPQGPVVGYENVKILREIRDRLQQFDFRVFVNGIEIFKPVLFPHTSDEAELRRKEIEYHVYPIEIEERIEEEKYLRAKGYIYHQTKRILPWTFRGVLIRVNNVGIGTYENRFSKAYTTSPIFLVQYTGEIYVDDGLDEALNIDRNSFFESDPAYQKLYNAYQSRIEQIFHNIGERVEDRQAELKDLQLKQEKNTLEEKIENMLVEAGFQGIKRVHLKWHINLALSPKVDIDFNNTQANITVGLPTKYAKPVKDIVLLFLIAFQIAIEKNKRNKDAIPDTFYRLIRAISS